LKYTEDNITIKGIKIHYYRTGGKKPPFILLHGVTDNGLCWTTTAEMLAVDYDVIMPDAQGHGLSDRLNRDFSFRSRADQVAGLIKQLKLKKPVIMGHSMGASTAADVAIAYPSLLRAIILEDPPWGMTGPPKLEKRMEVDKPPVDMMQFLTGINKLPLEKIIEEGKKLDPSWSEEERLVWAKAKQQFDASLFKNMIINPRRYDELVADINCPTLLIIAEHGIVTREIAENAARLWKSKHPFKWVQIKGAAHNIRRDNFPAFRDAVFSFLKDLPA